MLPHAPLPPTTPTEAFGAVYGSLAKRIFAYAYRRLNNRALAEDVTATTFCKAWQNLGRWPGGPPVLWLYRLARNECVNIYRGYQRLAPLDDTLPAPDPPPATSADLHHALSQLSEADRQVIVWRYLEAWPPAQVADRLGCSVNALHVRLHRALKRLRQVILACAE